MSEITLAVPEKAQKPHPPGTVRRNSQWRPKWGSLPEENHYGATPRSSLPPLNTRSATIGSLSPYLRLRRSLQMIRATASRPTASSPTVLNFRPAIRPSASSTPSAHDLINEGVAELGVVCLGVDDGRLYFEARSSRSADVQGLAKKLVSRLNELARSNETVRSALQTISSITIKQR